MEFEIAGATTFTDGPYDLVATFDCLHDMGDPVAPRGTSGALDDRGTWLIVEPAAGDSVEENLNPVGRVFYGFSTFLCVPNAVAQGGSRTLGAQAGEKAIRQVVDRGGLHLVPARRPDAVQPRLRGPAMRRADRPGLPR